MGSIKECHTERTELIQVHDHCPDRPYIELKVPEDAKAVVGVTFTAISRDQGWADRTTGPSFTWFEAAVQRPDGRPDLGTINVMNNRCANPEFHEQHNRLHLNSGPRRRSWLQGLQPGDVVQMIPKAIYIAWVNIVRHCRIRIEYEPKDPETKAIEQRVSNEAHYSPLDHASHEIRLLVVEPGVFGDPIKGSFKTASLKGVTSQSLGFHALSYCWGDQSDLAEIDLGLAQGAEKPFSVSRTVEAALRRLRLPDKPFHIWIDAVCINQEDHEERAEQVNLMSDIFSLASAVHIWLGEGNGGIETCLRLIRNIFNFNYRICLGGDKCQCSGTVHSISLEDVDFHVQEKKNDGKSQSFRGMYEVFDLAKGKHSDEAVDLSGGRNNEQLPVLMAALFKSPWFSRVWVVQEALLSHQALVHSSQEIVPWDELMLANDWLDTDEFRNQQPHISVQTVMVPIWKTLRDTKQVPNSPVAIAEPQPRDDLPEILDVFSSGLDLKATDPRDKLFALFSFGRETCVAKELDELVRPNYIKSERQVFADFTRWWIRTHKSLAILSLVHCQPTRAWQRTIGPDHNPYPFTQPTWALSSEGRSKWAKATLEAQFSFHATGGEVELLDSSDLHTLRLSGHCVSTIKAIGHAPIEAIFPYSTERGGRSHMSAVFDRMFDPCGFTGFWGEKGRREISAQGAGQDYMDHMRSHWSYFARPKLRALNPGALADGEWYETDKLPTCLEKCHFKDTGGRFGLCPWAAKEGDAIVLLEGAKIPFLLRPVRGDSVDGGRRFELVGEVYVDGIMLGEYFQGRAEGELVKEVFDLV